MTYRALTGFSSADITKNEIDTYFPARKTHFFPRKM